MRTDTRRADRCARMHGNMWLARAPQARALRTFAKARQSKHCAQLSADLKKEDRPLRGRLGGGANLIAGS